MDAAATTKLLLIDDEAGLRRNLRFGLCQRGYEIDESEEGLPALQLIEKSVATGHPYGYVIADINLPDINGLKLLELIKSRYPELPVIVISAYGNEVTQNVVTTKRGDAYLDKPFLVDELADVITRLEKPAAAPQPEPEPATAKHSVSAYALVKIREGQDVAAVYRQLYFMDHVVYCDAVYDDYDIVLLLNAATHQEIEQVVQSRVRAMPEVAEVTLDAIVPASLDPGIADFIKHYESQRSVSPQQQKLAHGRTSLSTYLFVDIEPGRMGEVFPKLYFLDGAVSCDACRGAHDAVVLIQSHSFQHIDRLLAREVSAIDGIVRTRSVKIINMFEM
jgi:CheY-like chemotaxis protein